MNVKHKISHLSKLNIETSENKEFPDFNYLCLHKQTLLWILNILWNHWVGAGMEPVRTLLSPVCVCRMMNCSTLLVSKLVTSADFPQWQGCSWPGNIIIEKIIRENIWGKEAKKYKNTGQHASTCLLLQNLGWTPCAILPRRLAKEGNLS